MSTKKPLIVKRAGPPKIASATNIGENQPRNLKKLGLIVGLPLLACILALSMLSFDSGPEISTNETKVLFSPTFHGKFRHKATGVEVIDWKAWIQEAKADCPPYPGKRFSGKGIVMTTGTMKYFTGAYVILRVIRDIQKSTLPIEVFYSGPEEMDENAIKYFKEAFPDVKLINIYDVMEMPQDVTMKGYQLKVFSILLSSFKEVVWVDSDNVPMMDPAEAFELKPYKVTGALFWPDFCHIKSAKLPMWEMFSIPRPKHWPDFPLGHRFIWYPECDLREPLEIETGQFVVNKLKAWRALMLIAFTHKNHHVFYDRYMFGDKNLDFQFNSTGTPYAVAANAFYGIGVAAEMPNGKPFFCANTFGQKHPTTGQIMWLHRVGLKYDFAYDYLKYFPIKRSWTHIAKVPLAGPWQQTQRDMPGVPQEVFVRDHGICQHPSSPDVQLRFVDDKIASLDLATMEFLKDLVKFPNYPNYPGDCAGPKKFFCDHPM